MWGGRFASGPDAVMEAINVSIDVDRHLYAQDIAASKAHAAMLAKQGIITANDAKKIAHGLDTILSEIEGGKFSFDVTPGEAAAGYVVRIKSGKARTDLVLDGDYSYEYYGYGDGESSDQTPRPNRPTQLKLDISKDAEVGKAITVKAKAPYKGRVLWTVETDHLITAEWKDAAAGELLWWLKVGEYATNV